MYIKLFILFAFICCPLEGMMQPPKKEIRQPKKTTPIKRHMPREASTRTQEKVSDVALDYFKRLSALETRINKFINSTKDYNSGHAFIVWAIEEDDYITWEDKQKLYDHYEEILNKKFKHPLKKSPTP